MKSAIKCVNARPASHNPSKIKKEIFASLASIFLYYIFDKLVVVEKIVNFIGYKVTNIFNLSGFIGISLNVYNEKIGIIVIFITMYIVFLSVYDFFLFKSDDNTHFKETVLSIRFKGIFFVLILFLFKLFQVVILFLILISIGGNKSILETPLLLVATVVGSFILSEVLLSSVISYKLLSKLFFDKLRVL